MFGPSFFQAKPNVYTAAAWCLECSLVEARRIHRAGIPRWSRTRGNLVQKGYFFRKNGEYFFCQLKDVLLFRRQVSTPKTIDKKIVHRQELLGCGDLYILFGGPLHKRYQGPGVCCLLLPQTIGCYWLLWWIKPVAIGSCGNQTSFESSFLYLWALGKHCLLTYHHPHSVALSFIYCLLSSPYPSKKDTLSPIRAIQILLPVESL